MAAPRVPGSLTRLAVPVASVVTRLFVTVFGSIMQVIFAGCVPTVKITTEFATGWPVAFLTSTVSGANDAVGVPFASVRRGCVWLSPDTIVMVFCARAVTLTHSVAARVTSTA
ncbi:hypothetical protein EBR44_04715 [bacterium]|nr:hypothetical protein [bacterium]